jgi:hypothetical protein
MIVVPIYPVHGDISVLPPVSGKPVSGLHADLGIRVIAPNESEYLVPFRIDPGAGCSMMSMERAERLKLLRPDDVITEAKLRTATGVAVTQTVRVGKLRALLPSLRSEPFEWPVVFLLTKPLSSPSLLGLAGVLSDLVFHFDGSENQNYPFGSVTISLRIPVAQS